MSCRSRRIDQGVDFGGQPVAFFSCAGAVLVSAHDGGVDHHVFVIMVATLGPLREEVSEQAGRFGERMKDATAKAGEKLKDVAQERGMSAVKDALNEVKEAFSDSLSQTSNTGR